MTGGIGRGSAEMITWCVYIAPVDDRVYKEEV